MKHFNKALIAVLAVASFNVAADVPSDYEFTSAKHRQAAWAPDTLEETTNKISNEDWKLGDFYIVDDRFVSTIANKSGSINLVAFVAEFDQISWIQITKKRVTWDATIMVQLNGSEVHSIRMPSMENSSGQRVPVDQVIQFLKSQFPNLIVE